MSKLEFKSNKLYLVKPWLVTYDDTVYAKGYANHTVKFINKLSDMSIATPKHAGYIDIFNERKIYLSGVGMHTIEGDYHLDVKDDDNEKLMRYLWKKKTGNPDYNYRIEEYLLKLKPTYTIDELREILNLLQGDSLSNQDIITDFVYTKKSKLIV